MAATATPTIYDPKPLAQLAGFSNTANTTIYTAPTSEAGVKVEAVLVTNTSTSTVTFTMKHKNSAGTRFTICSAMSIPATGQPVNVLPAPIYLAGGSTADVLDGNAGTNAVLDINVYGIEMKD
jgi:hypothetical protein